MKTYFSYAHVGLFTTASYAAQVVLGMYIKKFGGTVSISNLQKL